MGYPDNVLATDERVVLHRHPHWKRLIGPVLVLIVVTALAAFGANPLDPACRIPSARAGRAQGRRMAAEVAAFADGVIVGSAVVTALARDCGVDLGAAPAADPAAPKSVAPSAPSGTSGSAANFPRMTALVQEIAGALDD